MRRIGGCNPVSDFRHNLFSVTPASPFDQETCWETNELNLLSAGFLSSLSGLQPIAFSLPPQFSRAPPDSSPGALAA